MVFGATLDGDCVQNSVIRGDGLFYRSVTWCLLRLCTEQVGEYV